MNQESSESAQEIEGRCGAQEFTPIASIHQTQLVNLKCRVSYIERYKGKRRMLLFFLKHSVAAQLIDAYLHPLIAIIRQDLPEYVYISAPSNTVHVPHASFLIFS